LYLESLNALSTRNKIKIRSLKYDNQRREILSKSGENEEESHKSVAPSQSSLDVVKEPFLDHLTGKLMCRDEAIVRGLIDKDYESDNSSTSGKEARGNYKKPKRPCMYCFKMKSQLRRHITLRHKHCEDVKSILLLPKPEQIKHFALLRKQGILQENMKRLKNTETEPKLLSERAHGKSNIQMCSKCNGFYQRAVMWKHKLLCSAVGRVAVAEGIPFVESTTDNELNSDEYVSKIISRFHADEIGQLCMTDCMIKTVGKIMWERTSKRDGKCTMGEMRKLGTLLLSCQRLSKSSMTGHDMLDPKNFRLVVKALNAVTLKDETEVKGSLRLSLGYLLKKAARFTKSEFIIDGKEEELQKRENFLSLLDGQWGYLFNNAQCQLETNREVSLRRPKNLPIENDIQKLRDYTTSRVQQLVSDEFICWTAEEFVELRSLLVSRLTLYNGRRGGEPARLLLTEWLDADASVWITPTMIESIIDPVEQALAGQFKLAYQRGKGSRKMVPILIPLSSVPAIHLLVEKRSQCNISSKNPYLFASLKSPDGHAVGWQAVKSTCIRAGIENSTLLTATRMRHRASTIYALQDVPKKERAAFYKHMGHSQAINETVYQCPPSLLEVCKVGTFLQKLDRGIHTTKNCAGKFQELPRIIVHDYIFCKLYFCEQINLNSM